MKSVLVVDDEVMNRDLIGKILGKEGFRVIEAANGKEAMELLEHEDVGLVLMDLMMPVMDGFETIDAIRKETCYNLLPLIVISALKETDVLERALNLGADACFVKPFDLPVMVAAVRRALADGRNGLS